MRFRRFSTSLLPVGRAIKFAEESAVSLYESRFMLGFPKCHIAVCHIHQGFQVVRMIPSTLSAFVTGTAITSLRTCKGFKKFLLDFDAASQTSGGFGRDKVRFGSGRFRDRTKLRRVELFPALPGAAPSSLDWKTRNSGECGNFYLFSIC